MTGAQASYSKTLSEQLGEPDKFSQALTKAGAQTNRCAQGELGTKTFKGRVPFGRESLTVLCSALSALRT
jgi:hypothetical protein